MHDFTDGYAMLNRAERELGGGNPGPVLDRLCAELSAYRAALGEHWAEFTKTHFAHHPIQKRLHESPFSPERVLAALRAKRNAKPISMTEGVDPTAPTRFREHGGSLWFRGKGPERHPLDPARRATADVGGDD